MREPETSKTQSRIGERRAQARKQKNASYQGRWNEIRAAAGTLFKSRGFGGTSLLQIAELVGTDRASLYYYFSSKEELFDILVTDVVKSNLATAEQIRDSEELRAPEKLRRLIVELMESYAEHYPFLYLYLQENMAHVAPKRQKWANQMRRINRRYERALTEIIRQGMSEGSLKASGDPRVLAFGVMGMISWTHRWFDPSTSEVNARTIGESYADVVLSGLATS